MGLKIRLSEAKRIFEWQDVIDLIDEVGREIDRRDEKIKDLEQRNDELVLLLEIERSKNI